MLDIQIAYASESAALGTNNGYCLLGGQVNWQYLQDYLI